MSLTDFELKRCKKLAGQYIEKNRPPAHIRAEFHPWCAVDLVRSQLVVADRG